ncbi:hypothetical protein BASA50_010574 [Batrachochytrium salamandrivorans]|uniref:Protein PNS1 n=1 Tax=Batrachochytrium salamandrivorans TaxID=1357716 RepID=A0ABQ8EY79_9FUNG|nr:hypothetical protein BASA60_008734 [Batrachochytrium salamandrivorans]KAH6588703.1 hypothetical protein BASA50_010574 [Batrachochytrium salamandrivorans]KAH9265835.1 hypothetical protein BASA83_010969 [Batrachochytrium salamandrivorans]
MSRSKNDRIVPEGTIVPQPRVVVKRKCRDIVFLIIFIAYWVGMAIVAQSAIASGDPRRLIAPIDYLDEYCGANNSMTNSSLYDLTSKPYLYYIDPVALSPAVCISACPNITVLTVTPSTGICTYSSTPSILNYTSYINTGMCSAYIYKSSPILNRCVPTESIPSIYINQTVSSGNTTISANGILTAGRSYAIQAITDIFTTWPVIATFLAISLALCFIWLLLMQWLAGVFVWLILLLSNIVMIGVSCWLYFYWKAKLNAYNSSGSSNESSNTNTFINGQILSAKNEVTASMVLFIVCSIIAGLLLLISIALFKRIRIAVQIIKEASRALITMPLIVFFPMWIYTGLIFLIIYFIAIMLYLMTPTGPVKISTIALTITDPNISQEMIWYHLAGCIWCFTFLSGINQITIAGAIAKWYWTMNKKERQHLPVIHSFYRVLRYHLGSVALGSFLLTILELVRILLWYIQRQAQKTHNQTLQYIVACLQCCTKCAEMVMKFINKNAYIFIAIKGKAFFKSASDSSSLLLRNALRLVAVDFIADFILIISKLTVTTLCGFLCYLWFTTRPLQYADVKFPFIIVALVVVNSYMIATAFFSIYHMAIDTIFLSFLEDSESNDGTPQKPYFMSENLKRIVGKPNLMHENVEGAVKSTHISEF